MANDAIINKVYFSPYLKAYKCWRNIKSTLEKNNVSYGLLPGTNDIWVRDFMPIEMSDSSFVSYVYRPDYLKNDKEYITSDTDACYDFTGSTVRETPIVIDGGNVIRCGDKIIMTDKIFKENGSTSPKKLPKMIEDAFQAELILIPWDKGEKFGHADGMVRYVGPDHILLNDYKDVDEAYRKHLLSILSPHFKTIDELYYGKSYRSYSWAHLNFLQVGRYIFVPLVDKPSDRLALEQIKNVYGKGYEVEGIEVTGIVRKGGALNCVSWNIHEDKAQKYASLYDRQTHEVYDWLLKQGEYMGSVAELYKKVILGDDTAVVTDEKSEHCIIELYDRLFDLIKKGHAIKIIHDTEKEQWCIFYNSVFHFKVR